MKPTEFARFVDHTLLKPEATDEDVVKLTREAVALGCFSVCVNLARLPVVVREVAGSPVVACCVNAFPLGVSGTNTRVFAAAEAVRLGAQEIDTVIDLGLVKAGRWDEVVNDLQAVVTAGAGADLKVIIETCLLTDAEKERATEAVVRAGAAFVKTSTGFAGGGATVGDVELLSRVAAGRIKVKASGGIKTSEQSLALIAAGADRLGMSRTRAIMDEL